MDVDASCVIELLVEPFVQISYIIIEFTIKNLMHHTTLVNEVHPP
jgi:hypothetical protein